MYSNYITCALFYLKQTVFRLFSKRLIICFEILSKSNLNLINVILSLRDFFKKAFHLQYETVKLENIYLDNYWFGLHICFDIKQKN